MKGGKQGRTVGEIIRGMVSDGEDFETIRQSLCALGLAKEEAKVLVDLYKLRVSPQITQGVQKSLAKKLSFAEKAVKRKPVLRELSLQRRRKNAVMALQQGIGQIAFPNPATMQMIEKISADYFTVLERELEIKKELNRALLEAIEEDIPRRDKAKLRTAIENLKEL